MGSTGKPSTKPAPHQNTNRRKQDTKGEFGHPDDIRALCISRDKNTCLTASSGREPYLFLWNTETAEQISREVMAGATK